MTGVKPLDRRRASRIVARQLAALGHPPGLLLDEGVSALIEKSQGSVPRLRALLASTLFLASTEDAQQIGADLVQRAAESLEAAHQRVTAEPDMFDDDPAAAASGPLRRNAALLAGALGIAAAVAVVLTVVSHGRGPPGKAAPAASIQPSRPLMPAHPATPVQTPARASIPPPATVAPLVKSPKPPVPAVVIRYTLGDPAAAARMEAIGARLRGEKIDVAYSLAGRGEIKQPSIDYFFQADADLARRIAAVAGGGLVPGLKTPLDRQPGTIEIAIP